MPKYIILMVAGRPVIRVTNIAWPSANHNEEYKPKTFGPILILIVPNDLLVTKETNYVMSLKRFLLGTTNLEHDHVNVTVIFWAPD